MAAASPASLSAHLKFLDGPRPGASLVGTDSRQGLHFPPGGVIGESLGTPGEEKVKSAGAEKGRMTEELTPPDLRMEAGSSNRSSLMQARHVCGPALRGREKTSVWLKGAFFRCLGNG